MQRLITSGLGVLVSFVATSVNAQPQHHHEAGRSTGTIARPRMSSPVDTHRNAPHATYWHNDRTGRDERHSIVYEHRAPQVIAHDRFAHEWHHGYRPEHEWRHFYPVGGWIGLWGLNNWRAVSAVTCEAANEETGELYPVTASSFNDWSDAAVDSVLDQALDECAASAGANVCVPAQPACTFQ